MAAESKPSKVAVITGDLIASRRYGREQRGELDRCLREAFEAAWSYYS